jgi:RimJ/RimL family protein N-acetyltransferase
MEVVTFDRARSFRECADPLLLENEARNNLILGVTGILLTDPHAFQAFRSWVVTDDGRPMATGIVAGDNNMIVADARSEAAVRFLADSVDGIPGAIGTLPWIETFISSRPEPAHRTMRQGIFALEELETVPEAPGHSGPATRAQGSVITEWAVAFQDEAPGDHRGDDDTLRRSISDRIATQSPDFGVWVHTIDGEPVSMSSHNGPTPRGIRVSGVFTPPEHRGRGYATTLVARQTRWLLDTGHRFCFLYTDLANPTSNAVYQRIGYHQVAESHEYIFNRRA